jgi:hypothetical protein
LKEIEKNSYVDFVWILLPFLYIMHRIIGFFLKSARFRLEGISAKRRFEKLFM